MKLRKNSFRYIYFHEKWDDRPPRKISGYDYSYNIFYILSQGHEIAALYTIIIGQLDSWYRQIKSRLQIFSEYYVESLLYIYIYIYI